MKAYCEDRDTNGASDEGNRRASSTESSFDVGKLLMEIHVDVKARVNLLLRESINYNGSLSVLYLVVSHDSSSICLNLRPY